MPNTPPPRRKKLSTSRKDETKPALQILVQMGFTKQRAEKALAATGDNGIQLASDWLLSHVNDPNIDASTFREYVLYLCPVGPLQEQLMTFWEKSLSTCGWNAAHSYFPHITLCPFFKVENSKICDVKEAFQKLNEILKKAPGKLNLDFFCQNNYIGLFVQEVYYKYLVDVVSQFSSECKKFGIEVESCKKQLHVTLAYNNSSEIHDELSKLAHNIKLDADCHWEVRLYSRDPHIAKSEVRKVIKAYSAKLDDELDLILGDFISMDTNESSRSPDGWYNGTSFCTGMIGLFPGNFTQRTSEMWTWTIHGTNPISDQSFGRATGTNHTVEKEKESFDIKDAEDLYAKVTKIMHVKTVSSQQPTATEKKPPRQLFIIRHGERLDFVFGKSWCDMCFDDQGNYLQTDLNMPKTLAKRTSNYLDYVKDAPLTTIGGFQANLTGEALKNAGVVFHHVYSSPSYRCIQTATSILKSMGQDVPICIEPGIFEWMGWYQLGLPHWFTPNEMKEHGYNINVTYKPFVPIAKFDLEEDIPNYYRRSGDTAKLILQTHQQEGGNVLIIGHAGTLEVCTRSLLGKSMRSVHDFRELCTKVPYCAVFACQEDSKTKKWTILSSPIKTLSHTQNKQQDVTRLLSAS